MTQEPINTNQSSGDQPPSGISEGDWASTPTAVRELVRLLRDAASEPSPGSRRYNPVWPVWLMLLANGAITAALAFFLVNRIAMRCISPPQVSVLSAAIILLVGFHLIWRNIQPFIPPNLREVIKLGIVDIPLTGLITFCNEVQPWRLSSRFLGFELIIFMAVGAFLNLSPSSPFYAADDISLQGFSIERFDTPPEKLTIGQPLSLTAGEKVFVEAVLVGGVDSSCVWSTATGNKNEKGDCSTTLSVAPGVERDVLTVLVQPACGTSQESASLHIAVQP